MGIKEMFEHMVAAGKAWREAGYPLVSDEVYKQRLAVCLACPKKQLRWFQCKQCGCVVYSKAKLATEDCPFKLWPVVKP